jgi:hypothetical protein
MPLRANAYDRFCRVIVTSRVPTVASTHPRDFWRRWRNEARVQDFPGMAVLQRAENRL